MKKLFVTAFLSIFFVSFAAEALNVVISSSSSHKHRNYQSYSSGYHYNRLYNNGRTYVTDHIKREIGPSCRKRRYTSYVKGRGHKKRNRSISIRFK